MIMVLAFSPIYLIIFILCFLESGRPLFIQERIGKHGKPFKLIKFRTMRIQKDNDSEDTNRITKLGKLLRITSLDEIPSIYNIIKGDMSIVGPRPLLAEYLDLYSDTQKKRHDVKPGITGLAQIKGRNKLKWKERFEIDVWYVENQNFLLDLKIVFLTIFKVFKINDNQHDYDTTMYKFKGGDDE